MTEIIIRAFGKYRVIENNISDGVYSVIKDLRTFANEYSDVERLQNALTSRIAKFNHEIPNRNGYVTFEKIILKYNIHSQSNNNFFDEVHIQFSKRSCATFVLTDKPEYEMVDFKLNNKSVDETQKINIYDVMCDVENFFSDYVR